MNGTIRQTESITITNVRIARRFWTKQITRAERQLAKTKRFARFVEWHTATNSVITMAKLNTLGRVTTLAKRKEFASTTAPISKAKR